MTIGLRRLLAHMAWSNQHLLEHLRSLPNEALTAFVKDPEWDIAEIVHHIVDSADFYYFRISGEWADVPGEEIEKPKLSSDLELLIEQCKAVDLALTESVELDEIKVQFERHDGEVVQRWRSTILSQAIHHATEHRAQIAAALEVRGFESFLLDDFDLWAFEISEG